MAMAIIRTVLGDILADEAGITLTHEHLRYAYAGCEYDHNNVWDVDSVAAQIGETLRSGLEQNGIRTLVDLTPPELGRHPRLMAEAQRISGVNIVGTTGFYGEHNAVGMPFYWRRKSIEYMEELIVRDITEGMVYDGTLTPYKAGVIKVSTGALTSQPTPVSPNGTRIGIYEERAIRAAARAQRKLGCAINTHTHPVDWTVTNPGIEMLDIMDQEGADLSKVIIGHCFIKPSLDQLKAICARGANLQIDHIGIPWMHDSADELDEQMAVLICRLTELGYLERLVFSYDRFFYHGRGPVTTEEPDQFNAKVPFSYLFESFAPRLEKKGFGKSELRRVLVDNAQRLLAFSPSEARRGEGKMTQKTKEVV
jgi:phosphotriesterase-related protein